MKVIGIKLSTGEELIARSSATGQDSFSIESARVIGLQETQQGVGLGFMPWILGNPDATVTIERKDIAAIYEPKPEIEKAYLSQTSRIQLMG